jgi:hypothetical protein
MLGGRRAVRAIDAFWGGDMIHKPHSPRRCMAALPTLRRRIAGMRPAALLGMAAPLMICLLAAGCGQDDQRVPESYPSGERPAPLSGSELAAARADLPPAPPPELIVAPEPPAKRSEAGTRPSSPEPGMAVGGHVRMTGSLQADADAAVTCAFLIGSGLKLTLDVAQAPVVVELMVSDFLGAGTYVGEARVLARDTPHTMRPSSGEARIEIQVATVAQPFTRNLLSGTFTGGYAAPGVQGQLSGTFDRCEYPGTLP